MANDLPLVVVVTGGRDYADCEAVWRALDALAPSLVIVGDARGADALARRWAAARKVPCDVYRADWRTGRVAGPRRNAQMVTAGKFRKLALHEEVVVLAFPGGKGTANCVATARRMSMEVRRVE